MDEGSDFDYEMEPQSADVVLLSSQEAVMEDAGSDVVNMSVASAQHGFDEKTGLDIDFHDPADSLQETAAIPAQVEPVSSMASSSSHVEDARTISSTTISPEGSFRHPEASGQPFAPVEAAEFSAPRSSEAASANASIDNVSVRTADPIVSALDQGFEATQWSPAAHAGNLKSDGTNLQNEQNSTSYEHFAPEQLSARTTIAIGAEGGEGEDDDEEDQLEAPEELVPSGSGPDYEQVEGQTVTAVRVTFHGQDFVVWPANEIAAYLAAPDMAHDASEEHADDEVLEVEAPELDVQQDVLWQPLDSFFASLRAKSALGDFLDESQELHLAFPDLDLDISEDNAYCREITLDDLGQLHSGLGLATSLHVVVSERSRFITKYNDLAQHVAGLLGNQLQHDSDDSEAEVGDAELQNMATAAIDRSPEISATSSTGQDLSAGYGANEDETPVAGGEAELQDGSSGSNDQLKPPAEVSEEGSMAGAEENVAFQAQRGLPLAFAEDDQGQHLDQVEGHEAETVNGDTASVTDQAEKKARGDAALSGALGDDSEVSQPAVLNGNSSEDLDEQDELDESSHTGDRANHHADGSGQAHRAAQQDDAEGQDAKEEANRGEGEDAVYADSAFAEGTGGGDGGEEGKDGGDGVELYGEEEGEEAAYEDGEQDWYEEEGEGIYEEEGGIIDHEAEQTFYSTMDDASDAEEDELDEAAQHPAGENGAAQDRPAVVEEAVAHEAPAWKATDDEQIFEYTEELDEGNDDTSAARLMSTIENSSQQRKRLLADEDDDGHAQYEDSNHEAESKRAKVD